MRELRSFPPEIWFLGARVSHETKCFSEGQRRMSSHHLVKRSAPPIYFQELGNEPRCVGVHYVVTLVVE